MSNLNNKMKLFSCTNVLTSVDAAAYIAHLNFWYRLGKKYPNDIFYNMTPPRMSIDNARNWAAKMALEFECDYLFFLDDDVLIHPDTLASLIDANLDIVSAHTYIRGAPFHCMAFKTDDKHPLGYFNDWKDHVDEKGIYRADAVGFSACLIKMDLIRKMEPPYFVTGTHHTEDVYFCMKATSEIGPEVTIGSDTRVPTGHLLHKENVNLGNVDRLREFYLEKEASKIESDRGNRYYESINAVLGN